MIVLWRRGNGARAGPLPGFASNSPSGDSLEQVEAGCTSQPGEHTSREKDGRVSDSGKTRRLRWENYAEFSHWLRPHHLRRRPWPRPTGAPPGGGGDGDDSRWHDSRRPRRRPWPRRRRPQRRPGGGQTTPLDVFLWGYSKKIVGRENPESNFMLRPLCRFLNHSPFYN